MPTDQFQVQGVKMQLYFFHSTREGSNSNKGSTYLHTAREVVKAQDIFMPLAVLLFSKAACF